MRNIALLLSALTLLGSCQKDANVATPIQNTRWMLVQVEDFPVTLSSYSPTFSSYIQFNTDSKTEGLAPCNSFGGTYVLGTGTQLRITQQASTRTTCAAQNIEDRYLNALPRTTRYEISGRELRLFDAATPTPILVFSAAD